MRLAADANVLLSAVIGGRAKAVMEHPAVVEVITSEVTFAEVQEYAAQLAVRRGLSIDVVMLSAASLPVTIVEREVYEKSIPKAKRLIAHRDPDDVELLALALHTSATLWSNDDDFEDTGIGWVTTAELLKRFK